MNLVWHWTVKEWRAQRLLLCGYAAMMLATLATVLTILHLRGSMPPRGASGAGFVLMFMGVVAIGSVLVASATVGNEVVGRDDALWRRLPRGLAAGFAGKLLLQALVLPALLTVGAIAAQIWLFAVGRPLVPLAAVGAEMATFTEPLRYAVVALPWVFAVSFWLHKARLAAPATILLMTAIGLAATGILRTSPGIEKGMTAPFWLWPWLFVGGLLVAAVSCLRGRRGGDHRRSALLGGAMTIAAMLPPTAWLGVNIYQYWNPDLSCVSLSPVGVTGDGRFAIVHATANYNWPSVLVRVDLRTGEHVQLPFRDAFVDGFDTPLADAAAAVRMGVLSIREARHDWLLSLDDLQTHELPRPATPAVSLPALLDERWQNARRASSPLRQPDGNEVWFEGNNLCLQNRDGSITREPVRNSGPCWPVGHGIVVSRNGALAGFDFTTRTWTLAPVGPGSRCVAGRWLVRSDERGARAPVQWREYGPGSTVPRELPELIGADCLGLAGDDALWFACNDGHALLYEPAVDTVTAIPLPHAGPAGRNAFIADSGPGSSLRRDHRGRQLLHLHWLGKSATRIVAIDRQTRTAELLFDADLLTRVLHCEPDGSMICEEDHRFLVRYDAAHVRTLLWPQAR